MGILKKIEDFLKGKKTYIVAIIGAVLVGLQWSGVVIPDSVWTLLSLAGLGAIRSSLGNMQTPK